MTAASREVLVALDAAMERGWARDPAVEAYAAPVLWIPGDARLRTRRALVGRLGPSGHEVAFYGGSPGVALGARALRALQHPDAWDAIGRELDAACVRRDGPRPVRTGGCVFQGEIAVHDALMRALPSAARRAPQVRALWYAAALCPRAVMLDLGQSRGGYGLHASGLDRDDARAGLVRAGWRDLEEVVGRRAERATHGRRRFYWRHDPPAPRYAGAGE